MNVGVPSAPAPAPAAQAGFVAAPAAHTPHAMTQPGMALAGVQPLASLPAVMSMAPAAGTAADKALRELYIGNLPVGTDVHQLREYCFAAMRTILADQLPPGQDPILQVRQQDSSQRFAFIEFTSPEYCTAGMQLNGMLFRGQPLRVNRPKLYNQVAAATGAGGLATVAMHQLGANTAALTSNPAVNTGLAGLAGLANAGNAAAVQCSSETVLRVTNFGGLDAAKLEELFAVMGPVASVRIEPAGAGEAGPVAEVEFKSASDAASALAMHNLAVGDSLLQVERKPEAAPAAPNAAALAQLVLPKLDPTTCVVLHGLLQGSHCADEAEVAEIGEDVVDECGTFGTVQGARYGVAPGTTPAADSAIPVFVCFTEVDGAAACAAAMRGRRFEGRAVHTAYISAAEWDALQPLTTAWRLPQQAGEASAAADAPAAPAPVDLD